MQQQHKVFFYKIFKRKVKFMIEVKRKVQSIVILL